MKKTIKPFWDSFKTKPLRYGGTMFLVSISVYMFFGDIKLNIKHDKTEIDLKTGTKK